MAFARPRVQDETLYWTASHRLQFTDFRGHPSKKSGAGPASRHKGGIAGTIIKSIVADTRQIRGRNWFVVYASMKPGQSWLDNKSDSITLRHEQGHFDICEIFARKLRMQIGDAASVDEAKKLWNRIMDEEEVEQTHYDNDNSYRKGGITKSWSAKIRLELKTLDEWSHPLIRAVKLK